MNICIMGGTFNPIHNAHLILAETACDEFHIDRLLFMPGGNPPHKQKKDLADGNHRAEMVRIAISGNPRFEYCGYEIEKKSRSYTSETLEHFHRRCPSDRLMFIIGGDSLGELETWHEPQTVMSLAALLVFERDGDSATAKAEELKKKYGAEIHVIPAPRFDISSSIIRERLKNGKSVKYLIPGGVETYIRKNSLYGV